MLAVIIPSLLCLILVGAIILLCCNVCLSVYLLFCRAPGPSHSRYVLSGPSIQDRASRRPKVVSGDLLALVSMIKGLQTLLMMLSSLLPLKRFNRLSDAFAKIEHLQHLQARILLTDVRYLDNPIFHR